MIARLQIYWRTFQKYLPVFVCLRKTEIKKYLYFCPFVFWSQLCGGNCCTARVRKYQLFEANAPNFLPISSRKNCWQIAKSFCMETAWAQVGVKYRTNLFLFTFVFFIPIIPSYVIFYFTKNKEVHISVIFWCRGRLVSRDWVVFTFLY